MMVNASLQMIQTLYPKSTTLSFPVFPSFGERTSVDGTGADSGGGGGGQVARLTDVCGPHALNTVFATRALHHLAGAAVVLSSGALLRRAASVLQLSGGVNASGGTDGGAADGSAATSAAGPRSSIEEHPASLLHSMACAVAATAMASATCSARFDGALNPSLRELCSHLVPYPTAHFLLSAEAPLRPPLQPAPPLASAAAPAAEPAAAGPSVLDMTKSLFQNNSTLADVSPHHGAFGPRCSLARSRSLALSLFCAPMCSVFSFMTTGQYMGVTLLYRGDIVPKDVMAAGSARARALLWGHL